MFPQFPPPPPRILSGRPRLAPALRFAALPEANLNTATVSVGLAGLTFASGVSTGSFVLVTTPAIPGLSIGGITGGASGATTATLTLAPGAVAVSGATRP